ncbi:MAG: class I SAM-dependent methyltransferase [Clostridiaceae bacterium]|nr:class I SAM-dependent methyltransferase [Clostridiaceae bacterium]
MSESPERMDEFFNTRADIYDTQHIKNIDGGKECYYEIARHIPSNTKMLLDLGCGTGLELESIFYRFPNVQVTGIDLSAKMLEKLSQKYSGRSIQLVNDSYFTTDLGIEQYDTVISIMSFHHFTHAQKLQLYSSIYRCLKPTGVFIECDYMIGSNDSNLEEYYLKEREKIQSQYNLAENFYHYDTPFTTNHEVEVLKEGGFLLVNQVWGIKNNIMLSSTK